MNRFRLDRPAQLDGDSWSAVDAQRERLQQAVERNDRPGAVGASKELVECIARVVLIATGSTVGDEAKFPMTVDTAQKMLGQRPGDLKGQPIAQCIAQSASDIVKRANEIRNDVGTGHGRARLVEIDDATLNAVVDAGLLWSRWALARFGPYLESQASTLIAEVQSATSQVALRAVMDKVDIPNQPKEAQHAIGVVFGQRAAGGFGNADLLGVKPVQESPDLAEWSSEYRRGLAEGFLFNWEGRVGLTPAYAEALVEVLAPMRPQDTESTIEELAQKAESSSWSSGRYGSVRTAQASIETLRTEGRRLLGDLGGQLEALCEVLAAAARKVPG